MTVRLPSSKARTLTSPPLVTILFPPSGTKDVPISLVTSFVPHLSRSSRLRATSLSCSSLFSKGGDAEDLPTPGILVMPPLTSSKLLLFSRALTWTPR